MLIFAVAMALASAARTMSSSWTMTSSAGWTNIWATRRADEDGAKLALTTTGRPQVCPHRASAPEREGG